MIRRITTGVAMLFESNVFSGVTEAQSELVAHWKSKSAGRALPRREDIDPGALRSHLAAISIIEMNATGDIRFRLAGSGLRSILGREMRGRSVHDLEPNVCDMWSLGLSSAIDRGQPVGGLICREKDEHAWLRLPLMSETGGALILCHDALLPKKRALISTQNNLSTTVSTSYSTLVA